MSDWESIRKSNFPLRRFESSVVPFKANTYVGYCKITGIYPATTHTLVYTLAQVVVLMSLGLFQGKKNISVARTVAKNFGFILPFGRPLHFYDRKANQITVCLYSFLQKILTILWYILSATNVCWRILFNVFSTYQYYWENYFRFSFYFHFKILNNSKKGLLCNI